MPRRSSLVWLRGIRTPMPSCTPIRASVACVTLRCFRVPRFFSRQVQAVSAARTSMQRCAVVPSYAAARVGGARGSSGSSAGRMQPPGPLCSLPLCRRMPYAARVGGSSAVKCRPCSRQDLYLLARCAVVRSYALQPGSMCSSFSRQDLYAAFAPRSRQCMQPQSLYAAASVHAPPRLLCRHALLCSRHAVRASGFGARSAGSVYVWAPVPFLVCVASYVASWASPPCTAVCHA